MGNLAGYGSSSSCATAGYGSSGYSAYGFSSSRFALSSPGYASSSAFSVSSSASQQAGYGSSSSSSGFAILSSAGAGSSSSPPPGFTCRRPQSTMIPAYGSEFFESASITGQQEVCGNCEVRKSIHDACSSAHDKSYRSWCKSYRPDASSSPGPVSSSVVPSYSGSVSASAPYTAAPVKQTVPALHRSLAFAPSPCYIATTSVKSAICFDVHDNFFPCDPPECQGFPTTTITAPPSNPMCTSTSTSTYLLPCCGGPCPTSTTYVTPKSQNNSCEGNAVGKCTRSTGTPTTTASIEGQDMANGRKDLSQYPSWFSAAKDVGQILLGY